MLADSDASLEACTTFSLATVPRSLALVAISCCLALPRRTSRPVSLGRSPHHSRETIAVTGSEANAPSVMHRSKSLSFWRAVTQTTELPKLSTFD
ncbi:hypothetical protein VNO77_41872 [Canavalia gladiata]|uniref:Uncharacterized protein n=1 Tax=Canavalia gladiata TaxID=3824 RepID=A0AAN9PQI7_CANGL